MKPFQVVVFCLIWLFFEIACVSSRSIPDPVNLDHRIVRRSTNSTTSTDSGKCKSTCTVIAVASVLVILILCLVGAIYYATCKDKGMATQYDNWRGKDKLKQQSQNNFQHQDEKSDQYGKMNTRYNYVKENPIEYLPDNLGYETEPYNMYEDEIMRQKRKNLYLEDNLPYYLDKCDTPNFYDRNNQMGRELRAPPNTTDYIPPPEYPHKTRFGPGRGRRLFSAPEIEIPNDSRLFQAEDFHAYRQRYASVDDLYDRNTRYRMAEPMTEPMSRKFPGDSIKRHNTEYMDNTEYFQSKDDPRYNFSDELCDRPEAPMTDPMSRRSFKKINSNDEVDFTFQYDTEHPIDTRFDRSKSLDLLKYTNESRDLHDNNDVKANENEIPSSARNHAYSCDDIVAHNAVASRMQQLHRIEHEVKDHKIKDVKDHEIKEVKDHKIKRKGAFHEVKTSVSSEHE